MRRKQQHADREWHQGKGDCARACENCPTERGPRPLKCAGSRRRDATFRVAPRSPSFNMPTLRHFMKRHAWHDLRLRLVISHSLAAGQLYSILPAGEKQTEEERPLANSGLGFQVPKCRSETFWAASETSIRWQKAGSPCLNRRRRLSKKTFLEKRRIGCGVRLSFLRGHLGALPRCFPFKFGSTMTLWPGPPPPPPIP